LRIEKSKLYGAVCRFQFAVFVFCFWFRRLSFSLEFGIWFLEFPASREMEVVMFFSGGVDGPVGVKEVFRTRMEILRQAGENLRAVEAEAARRMETIDAADEAARATGGGGGGGGDPLAGAGAFDIFEHSEKFVEERAAVMEAQEEFAESLRPMWQRISGLSPETEFRIDPDERERCIV
jgi:hypothetical protein